MEGFKKNFFFKEQEIKKKKRNSNNLPQLCFSLAVFCFSCNKADPESPHNLDLKHPSGEGMEMRT